MATYIKSVSGDFTDGVRTGILHAEIQAAVSSSLLGVTVHGDQCQVAFAEALSAEDESALNAVLAAHSGAETLDELKVSRCTELSRRARGFIQQEDYYPLERQVTLTKLQDDARRAGNQDVIDYIQAGWDWSFSIMAHYFNVEAQIMAATTPEAVADLDLDLDQFLPHTRVQIATAIGMLQGA